MIPNQLLEALGSIFNPPETGIEYFLPADDSSQGGNGTPTNPWRIDSSAEDFDGWLRLLNNESDTKHIHLFPGTYWTQGPWAFPGYVTFPRPIKLTGSGLDTIIKLHPEAVDVTNGNRRPDFRVLTLGKAEQNNAGFVVQNLVIDGNEQAFADDQRVTGGIEAYSNGALIENVVIRNLRGSPVGVGEPPLEHEAFYLRLINGVSGDYAGPDGGSIVRNVTVYANGDRDLYANPFYVAYTKKGRPLLSTTVENCRVIGTGVRPARIGGNFNEASLWTGCHWVNVGYAFYNDTGAAKDVTIRDCTAEGLTYAAVSVIRANVDTSPAGRIKKNILVTGCRFRFAPREGEDWRGLEAWNQKQDGEFADIKFRDTLFEGSSARHFCLASMVGPGMADIEFDPNCRFPKRSALNLHGSPGALNGGALELVYPTLASRPWLSDIQ